MTDSGGYVLILEQGRNHGSEPTVAYADRSLGELVAWAVTHLPLPSVLTAWGLSSSQEEWLEGAVPTSNDPQLAYVGWDVYKLQPHGFKW